MLSGEAILQDRLGTGERAQCFYDGQMLDHLNERMREFVARQSMMFLATSDAHGNCDNTFRAGPAGFVHVLTEQVLTWPEYRGNGVMASLGNIVENPHVGLLFVDFFDDGVGLHVNARAAILDDEAMRRAPPRAAGRSRARPAGHPVGAGRGRRGLHPLLQVHSAAATRIGQRRAAAEEAGLLHRRRELTFAVLNRR